MNWREWWSNRAPRERQLIFAGGAILVIALIRFLIISPFLSYREDLREDIEANRALLENSTAYLARAGDTARQHEALLARFRQARTQLVPGDTPTLAAAALQDTLRNLANEKGIDIQSTQVMRDEAVGDFKRIAVRITVTGEIKSLADFLNAIEHGPVRVSLPFLEISRRGAALRGKGARTLAATLEVSAFIQGGAPAVESAGDTGATGGAPAEAPATGAPAGGPPDASKGGGGGLGAPAAPEGGAPAAPAPGAHTSTRPGMQKGGPPHGAPHKRRPDGAA